MSKLKLFKKFKLESQEYGSIIGGNYTSMGSDTNTTDGVTTLLLIP